MLVENTKSRSRKSPTEVPDNLLIELKNAYLLLNQTAEDLRRIRDNADPDVPREEAAHQEIIDAISERLYDLAWKICETKATTVAGIKAKATVAADWCGDRDGDVQKALAASLCDDLTTLPSEF